MRAQNSNHPITLLLDYKRAAQALCLTEQALRDWVAKGRGPTVTRIGRRRMFALADLEAFVERHRGPQSPPDASDALQPDRRKRRRAR
jgi:hypothetical protein